MFLDLLLFVLIIVVIALIVKEFSNYFQVKINTYNSICKESVYGGSKEIILVVGQGGSGKSIYANTYKQKNWQVISLDNVMQKEILPKFKKRVAHSHNLFSVYQPGNQGDVVNEAKIELAAVVKRLVQKAKGNVIIEGALSDPVIINKIMGDSPRVIYIAPKNEQTYIRNITARFVEDPDNYGRLGFLRYNKNSKNILNEYKKHGLTKAVTHFLHGMGKIQYARIDKSYAYYAENFGATMHKI